MEEGADKEMSWRREEGAVGWWITLERDVYLKDMFRYQYEGFIVLSTKPTTFQLLYGRIDEEKSMIIDDEGN